MSNYFWREFAALPLAERYPNWVEGVDLWRDLINSDAIASDRPLDARDRLLDALVARRASVRWGVPGTELSRPRLFVSHRKDDVKRALDVAALAQGEGFQVFVDVLDSELQRAAQPSTGTPADASLIAKIIEMALLNSTHVIALITPRTPGTYWVPYEYGRAKDSSLHSLQAACWIDQDLTYEPEYLELGVKTRSDDEIRDWLRGEMAAWNRRFPLAAPAAQTLPSSTRLTQEQLEAIARPFLEGLGYAILAPEPATFRKKPPIDIPADEGPMLMVTERDIIVKGIRLKKRNA